MPKPFADLLYIRNDKGLIALRADTGQTVASLVENPLGYQPLFSKDGSRLFLLRFPTYPYAAEKHNLTISEYDAFTATPLREIHSVSVAPLPGAYSGNSFSAQMLLAPDERHLYLIRQLHTRNDSWEDWVDIIELESSRLLKTIPLGQVKAHGDWLFPKVSSDGSLLHIRQTRILGSGIAGYQFTTVDLAQGRVTKSLNSDGENSPLGCSRPWWLSPDARYLYCLQYEPDLFPPSDTGRDEIRVTDMEQGQVVGLIPLPPPASERVDTNDSRFGTVTVQDDIFLQSPDSRYLYYIRPMKKPNVIKIDLTDQKIVASADLPLAATPDAPLWRRLVRRVGSSLVSTAEAKMVFSVSAAISGDGQHLYFPSLRGDPTKQGDITLPARTDGIWIVDIRTLAVEKHIRVERQLWQLWGEMHLSSDGRRLYNYDCYEGSVTGIDTATGEVTAFKSEQSTGFPGPCTRIMKVITVP